LLRESVPVKENTMIATELLMPELALLAGTAACWRRRRPPAGRQAERGQAQGHRWALMAVGVLTTIPLAMIVFSRRRRLA
jgi:hypothetical protein